jgi:hypothetical protein
MSSPGFGCRSFELVHAQSFKFDLEEVCGAFIAKIDRLKKRRIIEGDSHSADTPMQNDVLERSFLGKAALSPATGSFKSMRT